MTDERERDTSGQFAEETTDDDILRVIRESEYPAVTAQWVADTLGLEFLNVKTFELADEIKKIELPTNESALPDIIDKLQLIQDELESAGEEMRALQEELDNLVLDIYDFDGEARELIQERTESPPNPLDTRVVID
ncbi:hypothetical protein [Haladaptatus sp. DFWS20]|uniref:hypothetical protein n=1 Tax=Haladaptatus sp. DFWS20 TaxID=3403467 RepID=UPI003EB7C019